MTSQDLDNDEISLLDLALTVLQTRPKRLLLVEANEHAL